MTLFPEKDILTKEIESWQGFEESLRAEDRALFKKMLNECYKYAVSINSKSEPFSTESMLMALIFSQHKLIELLIKQIDSKERSI